MKKKEEKKERKKERMDSTTVTYLFFNIIVK